MKLKDKLTVAKVALFGAAFVALVWVLDQIARVQSEKQQHKAQELAAQMKAKIAKLHEERAAQKEVTNAAVEKVDQAAMVDAQKPAVEYANSILRDYGNGDSVTKG
jgi:HAMP domain-containing protein